MSAVSRPNSGTDPRKKSFYLPHELLEQLQAEARRQDRSASWLVQRALELALPRLRQLPGAPWP